MFSQHICDSRVFYADPDPTVCACLYVGDQNAYATYRKHAFEKQLASVQTMTANAMAMSWDWGPGAAGRTAGIISPQARAHSFGGCEW